MGIERSMHKHEVWVERHREINKELLCMLPNEGFIWQQLQNITLIQRCRGKSAGTCRIQGGTLGSWTTERQIRKDQASPISISPPKTTTRAFLNLCRRQPMNKERHTHTHTSFTKTRKARARPTLRDS